MMVVDSSALMAITQDEASADLCAACLQNADDTFMSAVTLAEILIVAQGRGVGRQLQTLIDNFDITVMSVDESVAEQVAFTYKTWGKGYHPARLNLADCFSYALAKNLNCPLLFVGNDFSQTDIESAL